MQPLSRSTRIIGLAIPVFAIGLSWAGAVATNNVMTVSAAMNADGRTFTAKAPWLISFRAGFSATLDIDGKTQKLSSASGTVIAPATRLTEPTPYGEAEITETTIRFASQRPRVAGGGIQAPATQGGREPEIDLLFRLGQVPGVTGVLVQAGIRNAGNTPVKLIALSPVAMDDAVPTGRVERAGCGLRPVGKPEDWLITGWQAPMLQIVALNEIAAPQEVREAGGFYRGDGAGFLFGPVGRPIAYVAARFTPLQKGRMSISLAADMSGAQVDSGATRWGQQVVLLMEEPGPAMARWAEWVGKTHEARTSKGALSGWNSWNFRTQKTTDSELLKVVDAIERSGGRLRPEVIQIDDAVEPARAALDAPWRSLVAERVGETGARFGLRLNFERNPPAKDAAGMSAITATIRRAAQSGFTYLKIACPRAAERAADEKRTSFEIYRDDWAAIRRAAGEDTYLLYAGGGDVPERATVGSVDASRVASDASRKELRKVIAEILPSFALQDRWFAVDPDVFYMAEEVENVCSVEGGSPVMQTWLSMVGLSCGAAITSEPFYWKVFDPYWRNMEVLSPPARERTEVLHLFTMPAWTALVGHVHRDWGESIVVLLFNSISSSEHALPAHFDFVKAGLNPERRYAVWSFWDNQFLGIAQGKWTTPVLPNGHSQHLVFTDLDRSPRRPVLIGSSLHIYCGAAEIKQIANLRDVMRIELTDAGARAGDLFVHSRWPLVFKAAAGCAVSGVVKAGENVWRISLADRRRDVSQRVELAVVLPVTRQAWFWLLIATLTASLAYAAWRYVMWLRLERQHALEQERVRLARDMHDGIGSRLARLSVLGEMAVDESAAGPEAARRVQEIVQGIREVGGELEHMIWSVNPEHDNLVGAVHRIYQYAEQFFADTRVQCQFDELPVLPDLVMGPQARAEVINAAKEALANVLKHAHASAVNIGVSLDGHEIRVRIADNGRGFDPAGRASASGGSGLTNMQERMEELGGECLIESAFGCGTTVTLRWPLDKGT